MKPFTVGLGLTAGISAYKILSLASRLRKSEYRIIPIMTAATQQFITPLSLQSVCNDRVYCDQFELVDDWNVEHIGLARECDCILVAPATADSIAKLANGLADELLYSVILSYRGPIMVAPAMNPDMYKHPATKKNLKILAGYGYRIIGPADGWTACGESGPGRMVEPEELFYQIAAERGRQRGRLKNKKVLLTSGPTIEYLDPMRYISNMSGGRMGVCLAETLIAEGAAVTVISGPAKYPLPPTVRVIPVDTAAAMFKAVKREIAAADMFIAAAAVSDYRPASVSKKKLPKTGRMTLDLVTNADILEWVSRKYFNKKLLVGFSAVSDMKETPTEKFKRKPVDILVQNPLGIPGKGPGQDCNDAVMFNRRSEIIGELNSAGKEQISRAVVDAIIAANR